jgi:hypothetical protein
MSTVDDKSTTAYLCCTLCSLGFHIHVSMLSALRRQLDAKCFDLKLQQQLGRLQKPLPAAPWPEHHPHVASGVCPGCRVYWIPKMLSWQSHTVLTASL